MLGKKIGEERGKVTGTRIIPGTDNKFVKLETSFQTKITLYGITGSNIGTYVSYERGGGQIYSEGSGIIVTKDGDGLIWNGHGVAQMTGKGMGVTVRFSIAMQTSSKKLAGLNGLLVIGEHETDDKGNAHSTIWEWK